MTAREMRRTSVRWPVLRGREAQLGAVESGLAAACAGHGRVLLLEGQAGLGRSALVRETGGRAERAGMRTLAGRAFDGQQAVPFAPLLAAAFAGDPPVADPAAFRALIERADLRYWVVRDLGAALEAAAARSPLAVVLDDLHWADSGTLTALRALTTELRHTGIFWVLTSRGQAAPAVRDAFEHLAATGAQRWELTALPLAATAQITSDFLRAAADPGLLALAEQAAGNPFVLLALLRGLREENRIAYERGRASVVGSRLPRRLTESLNEQLVCLGSRTRTMVRLASLLPRRFTVAQLAGMLQCRPSELVEVLDEAVRADLLLEHDGRLRFRLELLRQAVREALPSPLRRELEREAAAVVLDRGAAEPGGWSSLTETERRVVRLIVAGATNREAASRLHLSPHTINTHVRHVFAKLEINSRVQLARLAGAVAD